jgi:hypothetical protein
MSQQRSIGRISLTLIVLAVFIVMGVSRSFYDQAFVDSFFAFALASIFILHMRIRPKWQDAAMVAGALLVLVFVDFRLLHFPQKLMAWLSFLGLSSFAVMAFRAIWVREPSERRLILSAFIPAALFVASDYFAATMLQWTFLAHPKTLDLYLLNFDYSLRVELAPIAGQLYALHPWLHDASLIAYVGLAVPITVVFAGRLVRGREAAFPAMLAFLVTGPAGILFYNLFPACGPLAVFKQGFPFQVLPMADVQRVILEPIAISGARNAIPSLHMAWVLLACWYSRGLSWMERSIVLAFLIFTIFATLGTGEHWFVDLVVAFPFALFIESACAYSIPWRNLHRMSAICFGLGVTLSWLLLLRFTPKIFWTSPIVPWALSVATIALTWIRQVHLDKALDSQYPLEAMNSSRSQGAQVTLSVASPAPN